jgi:excisionase family DNA binding protein
MLLVIATAILPILAAVQAVELPRLLTPQEAADFLGLGLNTIYIWAREGKLPSYKISGAALRFDAAELRAWLEEHRQDAR